MPSGATFHSHELDQWIITMAAWQMLFCATQDRSTHITGGPNRVVKGVRFSDSKPFFWRVFYHGAWYSCILGVELRLYYHLLQVRACVLSLTFLSDQWFTAEAPRVAAIFRFRSSGVAAWSTHVHTVHTVHILLTSTTIEPSICYHCKSRIFVRTRKRHCILDPLAQAFHTITWHSNPEASCQSNPIEFHLQTLNKNIMFQNGSTCFKMETNIKHYKTIIYIYIYYIIHIYISYIYIYNKPTESLCPPESILRTWQMI
jgi:hypothetical protein